MNNSTTLSGQLTWPPLPRSTKEFWTHLAIWTSGLLVLNTPAFELTVGVFHGADHSLLIPSMYGTLLNAALFYTIVHHIRNSENPVVSFVIPRAFLIVWLMESVLDTVYYAILRQAISWFIVMDIAVGTALMNLFFFAIPAVFSGVVLKWKELNTPKKITLKDGHTQIHLLPEDILYAEASANYVRFQTSDRLIMERTTLKEVEKRLPEPFVRCHKSFIVNKELITQKASQTLVVQGHKIPIGRSFRKNLLRY